jgi:hypothetical protein
MDGNHEIVGLHCRRKAQSAIPATAGGAAATKDGFLSIIRAYRLNSDGTGSKFGEFEITCKYRVASMRVQKDIVYQWSVWKRFSEFEKLHNDMKATLGWQIDNIPFPSSYVFTLNKLAPEFLETRRWVHMGLLQRFSVWVLTFILLQRRIEYVLAANDNH